MATRKIINTEKTFYIHLYKEVITFSDETTRTKYYFNDGTECLCQTFIEKQLKQEFITDEDIKSAREYSNSKLINKSIKKSKKTTATEVLTEKLKNNWLSNWQAQQIVQSSSGDRLMRFIRQNPPFGYIMEQRDKKVPEGYNKCLEYKLVKISN